VSIGLDLGTSHCKAVAMDRSGEVLGSSEHATETAPDGTQDPEQVVAAALASLQGLAEQVPGPYLALGLSGAMHSLVLVEGARSVSPAWLWSEARPSQLLGQLRAELDPGEVYRRTGCPLQTPYLPAKLAWLRARGVRLSGRRLIALADWVAHALTGRWTTSLGLASASGLLDAASAVWDSELLAHFHLHPSQLPEVLEGTAVAGELRPEPARRCQLQAGLPVVAGTSDGAAACLGSGLRPDQTAITVGTSGAVRRLERRSALHPQERTFSYRAYQDLWINGAATNSAGLLLERMRELLGYAGAEQLLAEAASSPPGALGVTVLPYFAGERSPYWRADLSASVLGLGREHRRPHLARASLESSCFLLHRLLQDVSPETDRAWLSGKITSSPLWCQILADVTQTELELVRSADASALGAAWLALGVTEAPAAETATCRPSRDLERRHSYQIAEARYAQWHQRLWGN
jgi:gluconokinase